METNCSEKEVLLRLIRGDEAVFALLYERYHHAIYLNVIKLIHTPAEAEDIVQEVFLTLWRKRESVDPDKPLGGWLFAVSYHLSVDLLKKKFRQQACVKMAQGMEMDQSMEMERGLGLEHSDPESPEFQLGLLEEAINQLSPQKRKVFQLCKLEGKSYEQASVELGISKYTINEYLKDGMTFIRQYVKTRISFHTFIILFLPGTVLYSMLSF